MKISLCIATCCRAERLGALLDDLLQQTLAPIEIIVVDNDASGSALPVVEAHRHSPMPIHYAIQPVRNISLTRNRCVELARGEWIAFIDDDERAPRNWLALLAEAACRYHADGVLGPVEPSLPPSAPAWTRAGRFYNWVRMPTGTVVPPNRLRFGNVFLRAEALRALRMPFDPAYGLTGGEDGDLLTRMVQLGARIVWCDDAVVYEPIESARLSLRWLLSRALRGGQDFARHRLAGRYGPLGPLGRTRLFLRALLQMLLAAGLAVLALPLGRHRAAHWLIKAAANLGKLSVFWGWHYREYAGIPT